MERITPPRLPEFRTDVVLDDIDMPREGIGRKALLKQYRPRMSRPVPDSKAVEGALATWSGLLGATAWIASASPVAANYLRAQHIMLSTPQDLGRVLRVINSRVEPLSRYSAGWADSLAELRTDSRRRGADLIGLDRPESDRTPLTGDVGRGLRDIDRASATAVRKAMARDGVHQTEESFSSFVAAPHKRYLVDELTALSTYLPRLARALKARRVGRGELSDAESERLEALQREIEEFRGEAYDEAAEARRRRDAEEQASELLDRQIERFLGATFRGKLTLRGLHVLLAEENRLVARENAQAVTMFGHLAAAYESLHTTYVNSLLKGAALEDAHYIVKVRLGRMRGDERKRTATQVKYETSSDTDEGRELAAAVVAPDPTAGFKQDLLAVEASALVGADMQLHQDGALCWEAQFALTELARRTADGADVRGSRRTHTLRGRVVAGWADEREATGRRPENARTTSAVAAARDVELILKEKIAQAWRALDERELPLEGSAS